VLGAQAVTDGASKVVKEATLPLWANFRQRALNVAIAEINKTTDLNIEIESLKRSGIRIDALNFTIKNQDSSNFGGTES
jgi:plasmid replication initiation protein